MTTRVISMLAGTMLIAANAVAGSISITTTQRASVTGTQLAVDLEIGNSGDEAAHAVSAVLRFGEAEVRGTRHETLAPGSKVNDRLELDVGELGTGRWVFAIAVDYADANQYPFQALQMASITVGNPPPVKVAVSKVTAEPIAKSGTLEITVKNLAGEARTASVRTHVPDGIEVVEEVGEVTLEPWAEQVVTARIVNRTALPGSRYPVFTSIEYDLADEHYSLIAQGIVEITSAQNVVERFGGNIFPIIAIGLGALFLLLVAVRMLRG